MRNGISLRCATIRSRIEALSRSVGKSLQADRSAFTGRTEARMSRPGLRTIARNGAPLIVRQSVQLQIVVVSGSTFKDT